MTTWVLHATGRRQQFRCADCGARTCCNPDAECTVPQHPFGHRWKPMGTCKPLLAHATTEGSP